jgi:EAL and modified HD-GYP domain-containing signal transduction protein
MGICPAALGSEWNNINHGEAAGRVCWAISGTFCNGKVQGAMQSKLSDCKSCEVFRQIHRDEGPLFVLAPIPVGEFVHVARQPIFDRDGQIFGYELLYRSSTKNTFDCAEASSATLQVLGSSFLGFGHQELLGGALAFVNFPRDLLVSDFASLFPPSSLVIEVLETVEPDDEVTAAVEKWNRRGYRIALDDVDPDTPTLALAAHAAFIKVDLRTTTSAQRRALVKKYRRAGCQFLAEKVETREEYEEAKADGFDAFQGYFFTRPVIVSRREVPGFKINYLQLLAESHGPSFCFDKIDDILRREASLCARILRYVNSPIFARCQPVQSIREGMTLLGEDALRRWISVAALPVLASDKPNEVAKMAAIRGRFLELIAPHTTLAGRKDSLFLMGIFSLLDAMIGRPLEELLPPLRLATDVQDALLHNAPENDPVAHGFQLILSVERADWEEIARCEARLAITPGEVSRRYLEALAWAEEVFRTH